MEVIVKRSSTCVDYGGLNYSSNYSEFYSSARSSLSCLHPSPNQSATESGPGRVKEMRYFEFCTTDACFSEYKGNRDCSSSTSVPTAGHMVGKKPFITLDVENTRIETTIAHDLEGYVVTVITRYFLFMYF